MTDFCRRNFFWVSPNPLFLCGYSPHDVMNWGYDFYGKVVHPDDLSILIKAHRMVLDYFYKLPVSWRELEYISFDLRILYNQKSLMVRHKVKPFEVTGSGDIWLAVCYVSVSARKTSGHLLIYPDNRLARHQYSFERDEWEKHTAPVLTERDKEILMLAFQEYTNREIAGMLCLAESTVKNMKTAIFRKLNASNISEAIDVAINFRLLD